MTLEEPHELGATVEDQSWCTPRLLIDNSVRRTARTLLYEIPLTYVSSKIEPKRVRRLPL
jgi:hypothetical protein